MRTFLAIVILLSSIFARAQEFGPGAVTLQELMAKNHPADTAAPAAILYKTGTTYMEHTGLRWRVITEVACRIKTYTKAGYSYANEEVTYNSAGSCTFYDAFTYNLGKDGIEKTALDSTGVFTRDVTKYLSEKRIAMPNVKEGSIIEYKYKHISYNAGNLREWYFEYNIPAVYVGYTIYLPSYLTYNRFLSGYTKVKETGPVRNIRNKIAENKLTYAVNNVPAYKTEPYVNNIDNYISALRLELAAADYEKGEFVKEFSNSWQAVAKGIYEDEDFGKQLEFNAYFKSDLNNLLKPDMLRRQKMEAIFSYVQQRMNWDGYYEYFCHRGVKDAYRLKTGNVADINLILTAMLREAGLEANPVLVSTRSNGIALYPTRTAFNYVIVAVDIDGTTVLLDASGKNTMPDVLPVHAINWVGRIIKSNGMAKETSLMPKVISQEIINISGAVSTTGTVSGKARNQYYDYNAMLFRDKISGLNNESCIQLLQKTHTGITVSDYKLLNKDDLSKPVAEEYTFTHNNVSNVINGKIYFSPMLFLAETTNPFKQETRRYPIDFIFPARNRYLITITIPDGYKADSFPAAASLSLPDDMGNFKYTVAVNSNTIQLNATFEIRQAIISQDHYNMLKDFLQKAIEKQNEKIVLIKQ